MGSTRFPGKPLCPILGIPMIEHVYKRCCLTEDCDDVFVATCDDIIRKKVREFGGISIMTSPTIERPALRVAEACKTLELDNEDIVVVVQGDEPLIHPDFISTGIKELKRNPEIFCINLCSQITEGEWLDKDEVKVVSNLHGHAIYMSRSPIPSKKNTDSVSMFKQLGIFFFRFKNLLLFQSLERTPLEISEDIEMLRAIEHGYIVKMHKVPQCFSVDNPKQRDLVEKIMKTDPIWPKYCQ